MTVFEPGTIARVPFPYADRSVLQHRPALVVANGLGPERDKMWVLMVTSAENRRWPGDVSLEDDHVAAGLPAPSLIRTEKIAVIEHRDAEPRGRIDSNRLAEVQRLLAHRLGLAA